MSQEIWKPVAGFEGQYEVSSLGRVRSIKFGRNLIMKVRINKSRYLSVDLSNGVRTTRMVHNLVAEAFFGPKPEGCHTCHGAKGTFDNSSDNLSYASKHKNLCEDRNRDERFSSKYPGVHRYGTKWKSSLMHNRKILHNEVFNTELEAFEAYKQARLEIGDPIE